ncbi:MAG: hypothetical protein [Bacteriophage sp.]|nr:MAG: hypothetical protein [Bacteriophage sp.]
MSTKINSVPTYLSKAVLASFIALPMLSVGIISRSVNTCSISLSVMVSGINVSIMLIDCSTSLYLSVSLSKYSCSFRKEETSLIIIRATCSSVKSANVLAFKLTRSRSIRDNNIVNVRSVTLSLLFLASILFSCICLINILFSPLR